MNVVVAIYLAAMLLSIHLWGLCFTTIALGVLWFGAGAANLLRGEDSYCCPRPCRQDREKYK